MVQSTLPYVQLFRVLEGKNRVFPAKPMVLQQSLQTESVILTPPQIHGGPKTKTLVSLIVSLITLCVIGVGSPEGAPGRGDRQRPPDAVPGRLRTPTAASRQSVDRAEMARPKRRVVARGWQQPGGERRSAMDGEPQDAGPVNRLPFPSLHRVPIDDRSMSLTDWRKWPRLPGLTRREARGRFSRPFRPFRNYFRFCKSTSGFTPTSVRTLFPFKTFWTLPGTFPNTSGSRILLPVQHPGPEMECQQVCFTSSSDYIPPVPLESIFTRFRTNRVQNGG